MITESVGKTDVAGSNVHKHKAGNIEHLICHLLNGTHWYQIEICFSRWTKATRLVSNILSS